MKRIADDLMESLGPLIRARRKIDEQRDRIEPVVAVAAHLTVQIVDELIILYNKKQNQADFLAAFQRSLQAALRHTQQTNEVAELIRFYENYRPAQPVDEDFAARFLQTAGSLMEAERAVEWFLTSHVEELRDWRPFRLYDMNANFHLYRKYNPDPRAKVMEEELKRQRLKELLG